jgi:ornithine decarboxylase
VRIIAEPGRFYVASAFTLAVSVIARRAVTSDENEDASDHSNTADDSNACENNVENNEMAAGPAVHDPTYMYYVNDGVYGSFNCILFDHAVVHPLLFDEERFENEPRYQCSVWGPTCDGLDCITRDCRLPELNTGDWLLFEDMGAYTMSAASTFNGMPKPKCYHVMQEHSWLSLCRLGGITAELLPSMKTGAAGELTDVDVPDNLLQPLEIHA